MTLDSTAERSGFEVLEWQKAPNEPAFNAKQHRKQIEDAR
jgi:hypothetical protein